MQVAQLLFPDFSLIALGYLLARHTPLNRSVWAPIEHLVYVLFFPVLLGYSVWRNPLDWHTAGALAGAVWALGLGGIALAHSLRYWPGLGGRLLPRAHAASAQVAFRFNSFIGLALADKLAGAQGLAIMAVFVGLSVPLMNVGAVWPMARLSGRRLGPELARNPLIIGTGVGLLASVVGLQLPNWLEPTVARIGSASLPLGLMAAGAGLRLGALREHVPLALGVLGIRHVLMPLWATVLAAWFGLNATTGTLLVMFAALPTASSAYILASRMGFDGALVAGLVTASTVLGMVSLAVVL